MAKAVLVIDDEVDAVRSVLDEVLDAYPRVYAASGVEGLEKLSDDVGLVLLDINMPATVGTDEHREGLAVMAEIARRRPSLPVVILTSYGEVGLALEAGRLGALDYLVKMPDPDRLLTVVEKALAVDSAPARPAMHHKGFGSLVGSSLRMQQLYAQIEKVAPTNLPVLLLGPTGSGKDLVAREIHEASSRADKAFLPVNIAGLSETLFESELFGHIKGAFSGAVADKQGLFEVACGGTLFLDEVGTLPTRLQAKLLRVLEDQIVMRVGDTKERKVDTRVIAATNANLLKEVREGRFREDLYYRLQRTTIRVPPLVDRREDILALAAHFLAQTIQDQGLPNRTLASEAIAALSAHSWPGNVRELKGAMESAAVFAETDEIGPDALDLAADAGAITVHDPEGLYEDQKAGRTGAKTPRDFKTKFGEEALKYVLCRAVEETRTQAEAGVLLGFLDPDHTDSQANTFRQWFRRVGLTSGDILG